MVGAQYERRRASDFDQWYDVHRAGEASSPSFNTDLARLQKENMMPGNKCQYALFG
jgi:hypothetical protein